MRRCKITFKWAIRENNIELVIAFPLLRMKRAGKQSSIIWLVRQTLYHPWDCNISFSARRFSSPPWHSTNSFHSMLHHSRRHICHFVSSSFPPQRPPTWDSRHFSLSPTFPPIYQTSAATYTSSIEQNCASLPSCDLSFSHLANLTSVLFWMVGFLVSSKSLQDSFRLSVFRQVIIHRMLDTIRRSSWIGMCSGLRDSKRPSDPGSITTINSESRGLKNEDFLPVHWRAKYGTLQNVS